MRCAFQGCYPHVQQLTGNHVAAMRFAGTRASNWTLILEDDVVPLAPAWLRGSAWQGAALFFV